MPSIVRPPLRWKFIHAAQLQIRGDPPYLVPSTKRGVPHISLVFREMWDTTTLHVLFSKVGKKVKVRGIPHLAKNERDMGHPTLCGRDKVEWATRNSVVDLNLDKTV
jgi:hypothetical protein